MLRIPLGSPCFSGYMNTCGEGVYVCVFLCGYKLLGIIVTERAHIRDERDTSTGLVVNALVSYLNRMRPKEQNHTPFTMHNVARCVSILELYISNMAHRKKSV